MRFTLSRFYIANKKANYTLTDKDVVTFDFKREASGIASIMPMSPKRCVSASRPCLAVGILEAQGLGDQECGVHSGQKPGFGSAKTPRERNLRRRRYWAQKEPDSSITLSVAWFRTRRCTSRSAQRPCGFACRILWRAGFQQSRNG
jgi:hypothetical protein